MQALRHLCLSCPCFIQNSYATVSSLYRSYRSSLLFENRFLRRGYATHPSTRRDLSVFFPFSNSRISSSPCFNFSANLLGFCLLFDFVDDFFEMVLFFIGDLLETREIDKTVLFCYFCIEESLTTKSFCNSCRKTKLSPLFGSAKYSCARGIVTS